MIIYQVTHAGDLAESGSYFPTLKEAVADVRLNYAVTGPIKLDAEGHWEGQEGGDGFAVYIDRHVIQPTRDGLCWALKNIPCR